jgi:glycosyltransferase involved in cell wall biosynthesis
MNANNQRRIFTCTPVAFKGDHTFFARDSGLLSVGLGMNSFESRPVMPGSLMPDDDPRLIRTSYANLENPAWWKSHSPHAVVFFSWAMPQYTPIAEAIRASGAKLIVFLDSAGFWSPWSNGVEWFTAQWDACRRKRGLAIGAFRYAASIARSIVPAAFDRPRLRHMNLADGVTVTSPLVLSRTRAFALSHGFTSLAEKLTCLPLPVSPHMRYEGQRKRKRVICVARWLPEDWPEKGPRLLLESLARFLSVRPDYEAMVVGRGASLLREATFYPKCLDGMKLQLIDYLPNKDLPPLLAESNISLCSSFHESFHIASFEAACCGCSIVALRSPDLPALQFCADTNGTLAEKETPAAFADALCSEVDMWERGQRNPQETANRWKQHVHADKVGAQCIQLIRRLHSKAPS